MKSLILAVALALCGCEQKPAAIYKVPTAAERFKSHEDSANDTFFGETGRFTPMRITDGTGDRIVILDTRLGNVWVYAFESKQWMKISSPIASDSFNKL